MSNFYNTSGKTLDYVSLSNGTFKLESGELFNTAEIFLDKLTVAVKIVKGHENKSNWTLFLYFVNPNPQEGQKERGVIELGIFTPDQVFTVGFRTFLKFALSFDSFERGTAYTIKTWPVGDNKIKGTMFHIDGWNEPFSIEQVNERLDELDGAGIELSELFETLLGNCPAYENPKSLELPTKLPTKLKGKK